MLRSRVCVCETMVCVCVWVQADVCCAATGAEGLQLIQTKLRRSHGEERLRRRALPYPHLIAMFFSLSV